MSQPWRGDAISRTRHAAVRCPTLLCKAPVQCLFLSPAVFYVAGLSPRRGQLTGIAVGIQLPGSPCRRPGSSGCSWEEERGRSAHNVFFQELKIGNVALELDLSLLGDA